MGEFLELGRSFLAQAAENASDTEKVKYQATTAGLVTAYCSILIMSVIPIIFGSFSSAQQQKNQKANGEQTETMSTKDAMMFPLIASCALFGLYVVFKIFGKEHVNMLLTLYFFLIGVLALAATISPVLRKIVPQDLIKNDEYHTSMRRTTANSMIFDLKFDHYDILGIGIAAVFGGWYLVKKHWIANNLFGLAFAHNGITLLHLNSVATGCILLGGLFVYDVFWVFGTDVMVTVAKSFEAPIKLVFPQDFLENGVWGKHFAMLGLGDIVIPGIFIALLLRYDLSKGTDSKLYFSLSFAAYVLGLILTVIVMTVFKHAQPALLYLVPLCVGVPLFVALVKGEIKPLFLYRDTPDEGDDEEQEHAKASSAKKVDGDKKEGVATRSRAKKD
ncbi:minor histocompatibility antigen H13 [Galendromus occidentalis]|uniref:Minor histocompatibility antigen H13 n=1 Tax=Galendromus occidentalis TaxID=34638 RepID=A0AAJ6QV89_9ACAR|nr:minor histocompatibility antigen H13 [Galendromus occidentalis]